MREDLRDLSPKESEAGNIVIVGAGHAGTQLAASLREEGFAGRIVLISREAEAPYHKPPLSKSFMKDSEAPLQPLRGERFFHDHDIDLRLAVQVDEIDRAAKQVIMSDGGRLAYSKLVLAAGASARRLTVPGADQTGLFHLRTAQDARKMRSAMPRHGRVVVIGGGFIGLEAAAMLRARGSAVEVVELAPRLLGRAVSATTAEAIAEDLALQGVVVRCGIGVDRILGDGKVSGVLLEDGTELPADMVVVGIGAVPEDDLARRSGLGCDGGIETDGLLVTSDPSIFAIGDCAAFHQARLNARTRVESVQNANDQARALARTLTGNPTVYDAVPWFWSDIGALKLQIAGLAVTADEDIAVFSADGSLRSVWRLAGGRLVAVETLNDPGAHMLGRRLLAGGVTPDRAAMEAGDRAALKSACAASQSMSD
ncbi:NAD(P)/FAD-dependent oxidoreductase [Rhizobium arsenicireducens]|jgi:3-phenylpropionate/trans-cinnamate dioxygenase ferredoxin reductase subunit